MGGISGPSDNIIKNDVGLSSVPHVFSFREQTAVQGLMPTSAHATIA